MKESVRYTKLRLLGVVAALSVFTGVLMLFFSRRWDLVYGLWTGATIGVLNFWELADTLSKAVMMPPERAKAYAAAKYALRFVLTGVVVALSIVSPYVDVIGTAIGLLTVKLVIYAMHLFNDRRFFARILKREEEQRGK